MPWWRAKFEAGAPSRVCPILEVPADQMILDVGPRAVAHYTDVLSRCRTLLWNGPLGAFEIAPFGEGTFALARAAAAATEAGKLISVAGGGDTVAALNAAGVTDKFTYVSTAGGAFLEWLEGRELPGIAAPWPAARGSRRAGSHSDRHRVQRRHRVPVARRRAHAEQLLAAPLLSLVRP